MPYAIKKNEKKADLYETKFEKYFSSYKKCFAVYRNNVHEQGFQYLQGLLKSEKGKGNMERIEGQDSNPLPYHQYQHFLTNSPWSHEGPIDQVGQDLNGVMEKERKKTKQPTGFIIDESSHLKKGKHSVGVSRQYAGTIGKVDNCRVGVHASLCSGKRSSLVDGRLFLPKEWIEDEARSKQAGIPLDKLVYKTKPGLALEMVKSALLNGVKSDWVGGDGLYGHNYGLGCELEGLGLLFILDVHKSQKTYTTGPVVFLPQKQEGRGRAPARYKTLGKAQRADDYEATLDSSDWKKVKIRKTTKGRLKAYIHCETVWAWDNKEEKARKRTLIVQRAIDYNGKTTETKYSLSNGDMEKYSIEEFAFFQAQRYWVERNFDDGKNELGMSDYQVRKWKGWHHHHAIVMMAMLFMLKEQIDNEIAYPSMSLADARKLVVTLIAQSVVSTKSPIEREIERMNKRHSKRKKSTDWHFKNNSS